MSFLQRDIIPYLNIWVIFTLIYSTHIHNHQQLSLALWSNDEYQCWHSKSSLPGMGNCRIMRQKKAQPNIWGSVALFKENSAYKNIHGITLQIKPLLLNLTTWILSPPGGRREEGPACCPLIFTPGVHTCVHTPVHTRTYTTNKLIKLILKTYGRLECSNIFYHLNIGKVIHVVLSHCLC